MHLYLISTVAGNLLDGKVVVWLQISGGALNSLQMAEAEAARGYYDIEGLIMVEETMENKGVGNAKIKVLYWALVIPVIIMYFFKKIGVWN